MATAIANKTLTLSEFLKLPEHAEDGSHFELSEGELITLSPAGYRHGAIVMKIGRLLDSKIDPAKFLVVGGEAGFLLNDQQERATVRGADVAVNERMATIPTGLFPGAPLVAVEVVSPSNTAEDLDRKIQQYFAAGSQEIWVVYPETRRVYFYSVKSSGPIILTEQDTLESSTLDIHLPVREFFKL